MLDTDLDRIESRIHPHLVTETTVKKIKIKIKTYTTTHVHTEIAKLVFWLP